ncbi:hypothetical protein WG66_015402 [Moniliophthora roreri]|nr:hypothetical protein WG66_015402 [Moniliophthora roreri]
MSSYLFSPSTHTSDEEEEASSIHFLSGKFTSSVIALTVGRLSSLFNDIYIVQIRHDSLHTELFAKLLGTILTTDQACYLNGPISHVGTLEEGVEGSTSDEP